MYCCNKSADWLQEIFTWEIHCSTCPTTPPKIKRNQQESNPKIVNMITIFVSSRERIRCILVCSFCRSD